MDSFGARLKKTAGDVAVILNEAAQTAGERLGALRDLQHVMQQIRLLRRERDKCRLAMADLLIRMFDQNTFAEALLRPEYERIKQIETEMAGLEEERKLINQRMSESPAATEASPETPESESAAEG